MVAAVVVEAVLMAIEKERFERGGCFCQRVWKIEWKGEKNNKQLEGERAFVTASASGSSWLDPDANSYCL
jgi:hypothetical protein